MRDATRKEWEEGFTKGRSLAEATRWCADHGYVSGVKFGSKVLCEECVGQYLDTVSSLVSMSNKSDNLEVG